MEIKVGKYTLYSDQWSMWIEEEYTYIGKKGKNEGKKVKETRKVAGYSSNLVQLLKSFNENQYRNDDATEMEQVLEKMTMTERTMMKFINAAYRKKFRLEEKQ